MGNLRESPSLARSVDTTRRVAFENVLACFFIINNNNTYFFIFNGRTLCYS